MRTDAVFSNVYSSPVVDAILDLHFQGCSILDCTYGKGAFWKTRQPDIASDANPRFPHVVKADFRYLPFPKQHIDVVIFDPPHQHGISNSTTLKHQDDFYRIPNQEHLRKLIADAAPELRRVSKIGAILKITDMVEAGKFTPTHSMIMAHLYALWGEWPYDLAILNSGVVRPTRHKNIYHLRHAHSYFLMYKWGKGLKKGAMPI